jgi:hypothetical protein
MTTISAAARLNGIIRIGLAAGWLAATLPITSVGAGPAGTLTQGTPAALHQPGGAAGVPGAATAPAPETPEQTSPHPISFVTPGFGWG